MIKKAILLLFATATLLIIGYFLQPSRNGNGYDQTLKYELVKNWPKLPKDLIFGNPTGLGIDSSQNLVVFHRADRVWPLSGNMPDSKISSATILIIDPEKGQLIKGFGENMFIMPHGLTVDRDNNIWVTDVGLHQVFKFNHEGKLLLKLGEPKVAGKDDLHFNQPTDIAIAEDGSFYVSDGYGNSRIVKFSANGKYLFEWGHKGAVEGAFNIPHGITLDNFGNVYVADRENNRVQVFDPHGRFIKEMTDDSFGAICAVAFDRTSLNLLLADDYSYLKIKHRGSDVIIFDTTGKIQARFGRSQYYKGNTSWYHDLATDDSGNIYVGDILGNTIQKFKMVSGH